MCGNIKSNQIKSNQINFICIKSSHRTVTSHMYTVTQEHNRHNTSTNLVIDETMKYLLRQGHISIPLCLLGNFIRQVVGPDLSQKCSQRFSAGNENCH